MFDLLHDGGAVSGWIVAIATLFGFGVSRTDRAQEQRDKRIKDLAVTAVRECDEFTLAGEQKIINQNVSTQLTRIESTVNTVDKKLDDLLLSGRLQIKKD